MKPNILFIVIDSLRADKCHGEKKTSVTPNIDSLIENGTYFSQTITHGQSTIPCMSSILTGLYPFESMSQNEDIFVINPNSKASFALYIFPVSIISFAFCKPISLGNNHELSSSGVSPSFENLIENFASVDAKLKSNQKVQVKPAPSAKPLIAPIIGLLDIILFASKATG